MKTMLLGAVMALGIAGPATAATVISENFEAGTGVFTLNGNATTATGATYSPCCGTPNTTSNTFVAFGGGNAPSGTLSTSFNTAAGATYTVSLDYGALGGGSEPLTINVGGQTFTFNPVADNSLALTSTSFTFLGIGGVTSFEITSGGLNNVDAIVDNVLVTAVPEPATWALFILGFGVIGATLRRMRPQRVALQMA